MKLRLNLGLFRQGLVWIQMLLFATGIVLTGYCCIVLIDAKIYQQSEHPELRRQRANLNANPVWQDGSLGRIEIPRLGISALIVEGTSTTALNRAVGHIEGTSWPGVPGNIGLSAHRDSFFRPLRNIKKGDEISLTHSEADFRYRVVSTKVVSPTDVAVLEPDGREILTLVTCYPFYFIGPAPSRFIVRAERVDQRKLKPSECLSCFSDAIHDSARLRTIQSEAKAGQ
jgi:sortase A